MDAIAGAKQSARAAARKARAAARAAPRADLAESRAQAHLLRLLAAAPATVIAGYWPIRTEIDPLPVLAALVGSGRRVALPVVEGADRPLAFREWQPGTAMVEGAFGAAVPAAGDWLRPDALVVPLLAFDAGLCRLGYGGGFYDRTLAGLRAGGGAVLAVGFAFAAQEVTALPLEPTDLALDAVVTEAGVRRG